MFDHVGQIEYPAKVATEDQMMEAALDAGADDVQSTEHGHTIITAIESLRDVGKALEAKFGEPLKASLGWRPQNTVSVEDEQGEKILKMIGILEENDDVQNVFANFELSDALVKKLGG